MTMRRLVTWIGFLSVFAMAARVSVDTDTWWHLRTGSWILENGRIPQTDSFSFTRFGEDWRIPGWLVQVPMAWMYGIGGPGWLNLWVAGMVTLAFWLVWRVMDGGVFSKAFLMILGAAAAGVYWAARPYMVTFVLAAAFLSILEDWRSGRADRLMWLPALMVVWANSHGGFIVGMFLWGIYLVGRVSASANQTIKGQVNRRVSELTVPRYEYATGADSVDSKLRRVVGVVNADMKKMLLVGLLLVVAVGLNPAGPEMLLYPFKTVGIESLRDYIQEWQSPDFHQRQVWPFAAQIFLLIGAVGGSGKRLELDDFLQVAGWGAMALWSGRNIAVFSLAATVILARYGEPVVAEWSERLGIRLQPDRVLPRPLSILNVILAGLVFLAAGVKAASVFPAAVNEEAFEEFLPVEAVNFIAENKAPGRVFNSYNWGAYLLWTLPDYPVFVDGRTDLYNDEIIGAWFTVARAEPGWDGVLDDWEVDFVLIEPGLPLAGVLEEGGWNQLYRDEIAVVYER